MRAPLASTHVDVAGAREGRAYRTREARFLDRRHLVSGFEQRCPPPDAHVGLGRELSFALARGVPAEATNWRTTLAALDTIAHIDEHVPEHHRAVVDARIDEAIATVSLGDDCRTERDRADARALLSTIERRLGKRSRTARRLTRELRRCQ